MDQLISNEIISIIVFSLKVSVTAVLITAAIGLPLGTYISLKAFPGKNILIALINTGMGLPPVVVGLFIALLLWRSGLLGGLNIMYTATAIIIAQIIIAIPLVLGITVSGIQSINPGLRKQILALGASRLQFTLTLWREARLYLLTAVIAGFGAVISEVGAVLMVGGNIKGQTVVLTTAIVQETRRGNFDMALTLGAILLAISFVINFTATILQQKAKA